MFKNILILLSYIAISSAVYAAPKVSTIALPDKPGAIAVDFFGTGGDNVAILTNVKEKTLIGTKSNYYVLLAGKYIGPFHNVLDVIISPSNKKYAIVFEKLDEKGDFVQYQGKEYALSKSYSRYNDPIMGFIGDNEAFFISGTVNQQVRQAYLENKLIPGVDIGDARNSNNYDIIFDAKKQWVAFPNKFFGICSITYLYPDGSTKRYYHGDEKAKDARIVIGKVKADSAAGTAGFLENDILYTVAGHRVWGLWSRNFQNYLKKYSTAQSELNIGVLRGDKQLTLPITPEIKLRFKVRGSFTQPDSTTNNKKWAIDHNTGKLLWMAETRTYKRLLYGDEVIDLDKTYSGGNVAVTPYSKTPYVVVRKGGKYTMFKNGKWHENVGNAVMFSKDESVFAGIIYGRNGARSVRFGAQEEGPFSWIGFDQDFTNMAYVNNSKLYYKGKQVVSSVRGNSESKISYGKALSCQTNKGFFLNGKFWKTKIRYGQKRSDFTLSPSGKRMAWIIWNDNGPEKIYQNGKSIKTFKKSYPSGLAYTSDDVLITYIGKGKKKLWMGRKKYGPFISDKLELDAQSDSRYTALLAGLSGKSNESNTLAIKYYDSFIGETRYRYRKNVVPYILTKGKTYIGRILRNGEKSTVVYWNGKAVVKVLR